MPWPRRSTTGVWQKGTEEVLSPEEAHLTQPFHASPSTTATRGFRVPGPHIKGFLLPLTARKINPGQREVWSYGNIMIRNWIYHQILQWWAVTDNKVIELVLDLIHCLWEITGWNKPLVLLLFFQHLLETALNKLFFPQLLFDLQNKKKLLHQQSYWRLVSSSFLYLKPTLFLATPRDTWQNAVPVLQEGRQLWFFSRQKVCCLWNSQLEGNGSPGCSVCTLTTESLLTSTGSSTPVQGEMPAVPASLGWARWKHEEGNQGQHIQPAAHSAEKCPARLLRGRKTTACHWEQGTGSISYGCVHTAQL